MSVPASAGAGSTDTRRTELLRRLLPEISRTGLALAVLAALTLAIFYRQVFYHWTFPYDYLATYTEAPPFVAASIASGHLYSWSPFIAAGSPTTINIQDGLYFPLWWLGGLLGLTLDLIQLTDIQVIHVFFAGVGALILSRTRGLSLRWAFVAALAYIFFGGFYGEAEHADAFRGFAYLPWLLWCLTVPRDGPWRRICLLPIIGWLVFTGAYPGQTGSFAILGAIYVIVQLIGIDHRGRSLLLLVLPVLATAAVAIAVLFPYLHASGGGQLIRPIPATAAERQAGAFSVTDLLGLYLNPFAWHQDATLFSWSAGIPVLIGFVCARSASLRRQLPLIVIGIVALLLVFGAKLSPVAHVMADLPTLFPSRFPVVEYKAAITLVLILLAADAWGEIAEQRAKVGWSCPLLAAGLLLLGLALAPSTYAHPTRTVWLVIVVVVVTAVLVVIRPPARVFFTVLVALVAVDGWRAAHDQLLGGTASPWSITPAVAATIEAPQSYVFDLSTELAATPAARPARTAPSTPAIGGFNTDTWGWVADGYRMSDYGGTVEKARAEAQETPKWERLMLEPWHAFTFSCAAVGCQSGHLDLPPVSSWRPSSAVTTTAYSIRGIVYSVHVSQPTLMIENELNVPGWSSGDARAVAVNAQIPLRAWRLDPGTYSFRATFHQPDRGVQCAAAIAAVLLGLAGVGWAVRPRRRRSCEAVCEHA